MGTEGEGMAGQPGAPAEGAGSPVAGVNAPAVTVNGYPAGTEYVPDEDGTRYSIYGLDFTSIYRPEEFAGIYVEKMCYAEGDMPYVDARDLFLSAYSYLLSKDVDNMFRFVSYNKINDYKIAFPEERF